MADVLKEQSLDSSRLLCEAKISAFSSSVAISLAVTLNSAIAGAFIGLGWRLDELALLGVLGFAIFLTVQVCLKSFWSCTFQALITGYLAYFVANPWMSWTIENLMDTPTKVLFVVHGVHLLHGAMYCLFGGVWWGFRKLPTWGVFSAPAIWLILESIYPAMFPMRQGCLIVQSPALVQIASVFGVAGATLQVFAIASLMPIGHLIWQSTGCNAKPTETKRYKICAIAILVGTLINVGWGSLRVSQIQRQIETFSGDHLAIGVLQGDTEYAGSNLHFAKRTRKLTDCDLVLWPECSLGKYQRDLSDFSDDTLVAEKSIGIGFQFRPLPNPDCYLLGGGYSWTPKEIAADKIAAAKQSGFPVRPEVKEKFVSAFLLDRQEKLLGRHDKIELMAGGEYVPFADVFPWLDDWLEEEASEGVLLSRGREAMPIGDVEGVSVGALLCCEDMYPRLSKEMTQQGADLIVCLTNGMCFNSDTALNQHFNIGRFRAIENNRYFVRCGSDGVSGLILPNGTIQQRLPCFEEQDLQLRVPKHGRKNTWFNRFGDTLTPASYSFLVLLVATKFFFGEASPRLPEVEK